MPPIEGLVAERLLGAGGFGQVYLARVASDGGRVAVKVPNNDADAIMRLELEGETLRLLGGVHAPALYDRPLLDDGRPALVMEFVPMPLLSDRMAQLSDGMPLDELGRRALSILAGLKAVHELGLVHRDLKPENIFSTDGPPVTRIFDFGLVKTPAMDNEPHTTMGLMMGTPEYMAPEQLDSSAPVDQRADIYAIGAVLYEMLAGRPPFWGNAAEVQQALAARRAPAHRGTCPARPPRSRTSSCAVWPRIRAGASRRRRSSTRPSRPRSRRRCPWRSPRRRPLRPRPSPPLRVRNDARWPCWR